MGFFLADFLSGLFHWFEDTYLDYCIDNSILKETSQANEMHHYFPRALLKESYLTNIELTTKLSILLFIFIYLCNNEIIFNYKYLFIILFIFSSIAPLIHRITHMRSCEKSKYILFLQNIGIISSNEHHGKHHIKGDINYCINTPYLNLILDSIYFWRILESIIYGISGLKPIRKGQYNYYKPIHMKYHEQSNQECPPVINNNDYDILKNKLDQFKKCPL